MTPLSLDQLVERLDAASPGADPLRRVTLSVMASEELASTADDLVTLYVGRARDAGASWADIGSAMGVTKQAAQQRHVQQPVEVDELAGLDPDAVAAFEQAREEARSLQHDFIGTEHVLVGVLRTQPALAEVLGVSPEDALETTVVLVGRGDIATSRPPPLTARVRKMLDLAAREATALEHDQVSPADLVRGVVKEGRGVAARVLDQRAGGLHRVRGVLAAL